MSKPTITLQPALQLASQQIAQLQHDFTLAVPDAKPTALVVAGMGGSVLAADFVRQWLAERLPLPLISSRDYALPGFVGKNTLVVASSYSGNTEETLASLDDAQARRSAIVVMSSGGRLKRLAEERHLPYLELPSGLPPRLAVLYGVRALAGLLEALGLSQGLCSELAEAAQWLQDHQPSEPAKGIAEQLAGQIPVIYAGPVLGMQAYKWKIDINENAKNAAYYCLWPEFNHNEILGWDNPHKQPLVPVELRSSLDNPRIAKRFEVANRLLADDMPTPVVIEAQGTTKLQQMLWTQLLGDFVSIELAGFNGVDPVAVPLIEELKKELA